MKHSYVCCLFFFLSILDNWLAFYRVAFLDAVEEFIQFRKNHFAARRTSSNVDEVVDKDAK